MHETDEQPRDMLEIDPRIVVAALTGEASEEELRRLSDWRGASSENEEAYRRLARLWRTAGEWVVAPEVEPPSPRAIVALAEGRRVSPRKKANAGHRSPPTAPIERSPAATRRGMRAPTWAAAGIAAALVAGLGLGIWIDRDGADVFGPETMVTGPNEVATVTLEDETVIRLAPSSRLVFSRNGDVREVSLTGRAYFAVARDPERPFRVRLPSGDVEVLGTRFDIQSRDRDFQVTVVEGSVRMESRGARLNVGANQVARVTDGGVPEVERVDDVHQVIGWLGQFLAFESTPMDQVADEFLRRFGLEIEIADPELRGRTVTGWFADQSPAAMIAGICTVVEARCSVEEGLVRMELSSDEPRSTTA